MVSGLLSDSEECSSIETQNTHRVFGYIDTLYPIGWLQYRGIVRIFHNFPCVSLSPSDSDPGWIHSHFYNLRTCISSNLRTAKSTM